MKDLEKLQQQFQEAIQKMESEQEGFWNSLTKEQQLSVFCSVSRRLKKGELEDEGTYRYVLYNTFGFDSDSYVAAQMSGFLDLHNSIHSPNYERRILEEFAKFLDLKDSHRLVNTFFSKKSKNET